MCIIRSCVQLWLTGQSRAFLPADMLTIKFDYEAPGEEESFVDEAAEVRAILEKIMPEERLLEEVMMRIAESLFRGKPHEGRSDRSFRRSSGMPRGVPCTQQCGSRHAVVMRQRQSAVVPSSKLMAKRFAWGVVC